MAISKAEWAEIESKIARVDQAGIIEKQKNFEDDIIKNSKNMNEPIELNIFPIIVG